MDNVVSNGWVQLGFAGFCSVLLIFVIWLVRQLLVLMKDNQEIIKANTKSYEKMIISLDNQNSVLAAVMKQVVDMSVELYKRPCIARFKVMSGTDSAEERA